MRVLHVIPAVAPRYGGPSIVLPQMCSALQQLGIDVGVVATDADGDSGIEPASVRLAFGDVPVLLFRRRRSEAFKYSPPLAAWLKSNVARWNVVHIHAVLSHACLAAGRACRAHGVPYVVRPLGTLDPWSLGQKALKKRVLLSTFGRPMLTHAAAIHYTSEQEKRLAEATLGLAHGVVIPLGVGGVAPDVPTEAAAVRREPYILTLSRLHPVKKLDALIEAFASACQRADPAWRLVVAGEGEKASVDGLKRLAAEKGIADRVGFPGWVAGAQKRALLQGASLFALPSLHENFGVSLVEALACGVPAIVSEHVHLCDEIRDAGAGWVTSLEPEQLAHVLEEAMSSPQERDRRGGAARTMSRRFAWPVVARELVALYERVARAAAEAPAYKF